MADVYIVYTGADRGTAQRLHDAIEEQWTVFWDDDIVGPYAKVIEAEMPGAGCVIYVHSGSSRDRDMVLDELRIARDSKCTIIPVKLDNSPAPYGYGIFSGVTLTNWSGDQTDQGWKKLVTKISALVAPRTQPIRPPSILCGRLPLPCLFMSVSSHETQLSPEDALTVAAAIHYPNVLVSAYDWIKGKPEHIEARTQALSDLKATGALVLMDSGNYEASRRKDETWTVRTFAEALDKAPHDLACSFDVMEPSSDPARAFDEIVAGVRRDQAYTAAPIVPIVHVPKLEAGGHDLDQFPELVRRLAEELEPPLLAIPERELGPGLICRIKSMLRIRAALSALPIYQPIHLLGTGNPWSIVTLAAAGADSFDGLEWCRVVVDREHHRLNHFQHFDFFAWQSLASTSDAIRGALRSEEIHFAGKAAIHNLDYYAELARDLQTAAGRQALETLVMSLLQKGNAGQLNAAVADLFP